MAYPCPWLHGALEAVKVLEALGEVKDFFCCSVLVTAIALCSSMPSSLVSEPPPPHN
jgi:hypothetical protein